MSDRQATCEERIQDQWNSRKEDFNFLTSIVMDAEDFLGESKENREIARNQYDFDIPEPEDMGLHDDDPNWYEYEEQAREQLSYMPLGVSVERVLRIDLSTGGPGDWLEAKVEKLGQYSWEVVSVTYHFNDWWDHAEIELHGEDEGIATNFIENVVPLDSLDAYDG